MSRRKLSLMVRHPDLKPHVAAVGTLRLEKVPEIRQAHAPDPALERVS